VSTLLTIGSKIANLANPLVVKSARMENEEPADKRPSTESKDTTLKLLVETQKFKHDLEIETKGGDLDDDTNLEEEIELEPPQISKILFILCQLLTEPTTRSCW